MTKIQNSKRLHLLLERRIPKHVWVIEYWNLEFICNLVLGIWDLVMLQYSKSARHL
jgi:hypothetical protein